MHRNPCLPNDCTVNSVPHTEQQIHKLPGNVARRSIVLQAQVRVVAEDGGSFKAKQLAQLVHRGAKQASWCPVSDKPLAD